MSDPFTYRSVYWVWLNELRGVSLGVKRTLLKELGDPKEIFHASLATVTEALAHAHNHRHVKSNLESVWSQRNLKYAESVLTKHDDHDIKTLCANDWRYATIFQRDELAPPVLYYRGQLADPDIPVTGIIGSRSCTSYGRKVAKAAVHETVGKGQVVASGLSFGIDALAHETTIAQQGKTYAFLPCGLHKAQPASHSALMERIVEHGAVITPYPHGKEALPFRFIGRNDVLVSWCETLLVVEARLKSGSMHTARSALKRGKRVLAVPNSLLEPKSRGTNHLLAEGAQAYLNDTLSLDSRDVHLHAGSYGEAIIRTLGETSLATWEIVNAVGGDIIPVMESLAALEAADTLEYRQDGKWHVAGGP